MQNCRTTQNPTGQGSSLTRKVAPMQMRPKVKEGLPLPYYHTKTSPWLVPWQRSPECTLQLFQKLPPLFRKSDGCTYLLPLKSFWPPFPQEEGVFRVWALLCLFLDQQWRFCSALADLVSFNFHKQHLQWKDPTEFCLIWEGW